jgi:hypothetical protein
VNPPAHALEELDRAKTAVARMQTAISLADFEEQWKEFLRRLERVWNKAANHFGKSPKWNGWKGRYEKQRSTDELLLYFHFARGAEEHSIAPIVENQPERLSLTGKSGHPFVTGVKVENGSLVLEVDPVVQVAIEPALLKLLPVTHRGRRYEVPSKHLGKTIGSHNLIELSEMGIEYYAKLLENAEERFCTTGRKIKAIKRARLELS